MMRTNEPLPLLRDLPPLCPVLRCCACQNLVLQSEVCTARDEAEQCLQQQFQLGFWDGGHGR